MDGGNAWELVEDKEPDNEASPAAPRSPSQAAATSSAGQEMVYEVDGEEFRAEELNEIVEEQVREEEMQRKRKSKSPAIESIHRVGRSVMKHINKWTKKEEDEQEEASQTSSVAAPMQRSNILGVADLITVPMLVKTSRSVSPQPTSSAKATTAAEAGGGGRAASPELRERVAYLFRSPSCDILPTSAGYVPVAAEKACERREVYDPFCPVHGSRRRLAKRNLMSMHHYMQSLEQQADDSASDTGTGLENVRTGHAAAMSHETPLLYSQAFAAKMLRKRKRAQLSGPAREKAEKAKRKIRINLLVISLVFLFLFTAFHGLQNLQTTLNGRLGADALFIHYLTLAISSLFMPSFLIGRLGCKLTIVVSVSVFILYLFTNFFPRYSSLLPSSVLAGVAGSCLWGAKCVYITECGVKYAKLNIEHQPTVIVRFFGYFFMVVHMGQVVGNLISMSILARSMPAYAHIDLPDRTCGSSFPALADNYSHAASKMSDRAKMRLTKPPTAAYLSVCAVFVCCALVALMIVSCFLNALQRDAKARQKEPQFKAEILKETLRAIREPKIVFLLPLTLFNGLEQAFIVGIFTQAYVGCGLGVAEIGRVMTAFGACDAVFSLVFGPLIKLFGRMPLFVFGSVINVMMLITCMIWPVNPADTAIFYVIACVWGMADGVWKTQINGIWVALLGRRSVDLAFANYRFWESLGLAAGFLLMRVFPVSVFLFVAFFLLLLGMVGYVAIEFYDGFKEYLVQLCVVCKRPPEQEGERLRALMQASMMTRSTTAGKSRV